MRAPIAIPRRRHGRLPLPTAVAEAGVSVPSPTLSSGSRKHKYVVPETLRMPSLYYCWRKLKKYCTTVGGNSKNIVDLMLRSPVLGIALSFGVEAPRSARLWGGFGGPAARVEPALGLQEGFDHIIPEHDQGGHRSQTLRYSFIPA